MCEDFFGHRKAARSDKAEVAGSSPVSATRKVLKSWLNSDKELITYQLLADGFRGAYGQIPSDF